VSPSLFHTAELLHQESSVAVWVPQPVKTRTFAPASRVKPEGKR
jgi:hypothetical protein